MTQYKERLDVAQEKLQLGHQAGMKKRGAPGLGLLESEIRFLLQATSSGALQTTSEIAVVDNHFIHDFTSDAEGLATFPHARASKKWQLDVAQSNKNSRANL